MYMYVYYECVLHVTVCLTSSIYIHVHIHIGVCMSCDLLKFYSTGQQFIGVLIIPFPEILYIFSAVGMQRLRDHALTVTCDCFT